MQYFVIFEPNRRFADGEMPEDFPALEKAEQAQAQRLYEDGGLRQLWALHTARRGAAVLFEAETSQHLRTMIESFPLIEADYAEYQTFPLAPHPAFAARTRA